MSVGCFLVNYSLISPLWFWCCTSSCWRSPICVLSTVILASFGTVPGWRFGSRTASESSPGFSSMTSSCRFTILCLSQSPSFLKWSFSSISFFLRSPIVNANAHLAKLIFIQEPFWAPQIFPFTFLLPFIFFKLSFWSFRRFFAALIFFVHLFTWVYLFILFPFWVFGICYVFLC